MSTQGQRDLVALQFNASKEEKVMRMMNCFLVVAALLVVTLTSNRPIRGAEEKKELKDVPKACVESVKKRFPKGELTDASKEETDDGKTVYEISVKQEGKNTDVTLTPEGVITMIEQQIAEKDLPKEVTGGVEKKYPKPKYEIAESVTVVENGKEKLSYYEVLVATADGKKVEIEVGLDGKIKKEEDKTGDKDDEKGEKAEKKSEKKSDKKPEKKNK